MLAGYACLPRFGEMSACERPATCSSSSARIQNTIRLPAYARCSPPVRCGVSGEEESVAWPARRMAEGTTASSNRGNHQLQLWGH